MVADTAIGLVLARESAAQTACDQLIELALEHGGKDNVTLVLCDIAGRGRVA